VEEVLVTAAPSQFEDPIFSLPDSPFEAFGQVNEGIWCFDKSGRTTYVNECMAQMLGYSRSEMLAKPLWDFLDDESRTRALCHAASAEQEISPRLKIGLVRKDHRIVHTLISTSRTEPDCDSVAVVIDITDSTERERHLKHQAALAEKSNAAKSRFLSLMSHEIRSPLASIVGFAELLGDEGTPEPDRSRFTDIIVRNGRFLMSLVGDLLDLGKIEAGKFEFNRSTFSLRDVLGDACSVLTQRANESGTTITLNYPALSSDLVYTDKLRVQQILVNVIGNAVKFTQCGQVTITVGRSDGTEGAGTYRSPGDFFVIFVADTGIGISAEQAAMLFHDFTQADPNISARFGGSGLGLALSKRLAQALGGDVWLESSELGKGSTFAIRLPLGVLPMRIDPDRTAPALKASQI
jgi:PAS domain S-box-containing protein